MPHDETPPNLIWERPSRAGRSGLSRDQIVRAAMLIGDTEGLDAISIRRIATDLGSGTMSLYRHIDSKEDLLDLMLDAAFGEIGLPDLPPADWRERSRQLATATRAVYLRHPWLTVLTISRPTIGPSYLRWFECWLASFADQGLDIATAMQLVGVVQAYVGGVVAYEVAEAEHSRRLDMSEEAKRAAATPYVQRVVAGGQLPNFARFFAAQVQPDPEQSFAFGLDCVLAGIAARCPQLGG
ncbi:TetR family transcriptional regulator [Chloroflexia bacterium SDU3-3]|nr:TetR family transcriptional regulator [Chloroflexia bacterium SDU3-3]